MRSIAKRRIRINYTRVYRQFCTCIGSTFEQSQWSADNVVFGTGGALLQRVDRDTQKCAFKCSYVEVKGQGRNVFKQPITDAVKKSKRGKLTLELRHDGTYATVEKGKGNPALDQMVTVYENGRIIRDHTLSEIRERAEIDIVKQSVAENGKIET